MDKTTTPTPVAIPVTTQTFTLEQVLELLQRTKGASATEIADAVRATQPPPKVTYGQYRRQQLAGRPKLKRPFLENGQRIPDHMLTPTEITLLNQVSRSGRYIDRLIEVILRSEHGEESVEVRFNNNGSDRVLELKEHFRSAADMWAQIIAAQKIENEEDAADEEFRKSRGGRTFGNSKASREARERLETEA